MKTLRSAGHAALVDTLKKVRKSAGLSQEGLAKRLKKHQSYVSKVEAAERRIDAVEMCAWAEACDVEPIVLFSLFVTRLGRRP